jgi:hypothetical protein
MVPKGQETTADQDERTDQGDPPAKKKPRKPLKLDASILERALQQRNQNR